MTSTPTLILSFEIIIVDHILQLLLISCWSICLRLVADEHVFSRRCTQIQGSVTTRVFAISPVAFNIRIQHQVLLQKQSGKCYKSVHNSFLLLQRYQSQEQRIKFPRNISVQCTNASHYRKSFEYVVR